MKVVATQKIKGMKKQGKWRLCQTTESKCSVKVLDCQGGRKETQIQDITHMDRDPEQRHCGHGNFNDGACFYSPAVRLKRSEALVEAPKEPFTLSTFLCCELGGSKIISAGQRSYKGRKGGGIVTVSTP
jgi:hypothetical protein